MSLRIRAGKTEKLSKADEQLLDAARRNDVSGVSEALQQGANINAASPLGRTALMYASSNGNFEIVKLLIKNGADVRKRSNNGYTALRLAKAKKHNEIAKYLASQGAKKWWDIFHLS